MLMPEMESRVSDATNQSVESSGSDIRHVLEEQRSGVDNFDAQIGGSENAPRTCAVDFDAGDTVGPFEDMKDAAEQPASVIMDNLDAQNGSIRETMVSNAEELQMDMASQPESTSAMHDDHPSRNSARSWYLGYGLEMGDMVWGRVKSHPWWPGHIFNEAFASSSVRRTKKDGHVLVAFFGDGSYGWFDPAELIPYESHFLEKSQQSTSRNFVKAVQESVDEACRRSALGLTCFCRNPNNFRPTNVPRHMAVDVSDYEAGAIYSDNQIQKGRDNFQPEWILSFIEQLAAAPKEATTSLDFVRQKTAALAYRRAVFEEFDETYAQAFGQAHVRPIVAPPPSVDQSIKAQLSGPLVIAESLSGRKSSTKAIKSKRDKYQLKRRDESGDMVSTQVGQGHSSSSSSAASEVQRSHAEAGDYVLQKRIQAVDQQDGVSTPAKDEVAASSGSPNKPSMVQDQSDPPTVKSKKAGVLKGGLKRSAAENSELRERKKKKKRATDSPGSSDHLQKHSSQTVAPYQVDSQPKGIVSTSSASEQVPSGPAMSAEENESELNRVLADLKILALYPSHGRERNRPVIVRKFFLKFRSFVFQKSLTVPPLSTSNAKEANPAPPSRPPKPLGRTDDPTKGLKKRVPSERQEDLATKRAKKVSAMKSASEKTKAGPETQQHPQRIGAKMQPPQKVRVEEATFLVMKYPPGTSLPSSAELKARFARFGPMDTSQNRVFYTTNTCRIMFLYKEDADNAHKFALRNKSAFANVRFMLRPQSSPSDSQATTDNNNSQQSPAVQLKSCLKKTSAGDEGGSQGARGARVRFNIGETTGSGGGSSTSSSSSLCVANAMDSSSHKNEQQKVFSTHPSLQPSPPPFVSDPRNNVEAPSRSRSQNHNYVTKLPPPPPPPPGRAPLSLPPVVDISQQMMRLLTRCNDVVTNVKSVLGYVPYRPL